MIKVNTIPDSRVCQGDILRDVEFIEYAEEKGGNLTISKIVFPLVVVLTQDCDLEQEDKSRQNEKSSNNDKYLISIIVAPLYNFQQFITGSHLERLDLKMQAISPKPEKTDHKFIIQNQNPRYHYLKFEDTVPLVDCIADFKHYFTVNLQYMMNRKKTHFVGKIYELYRESITQRFSHFLSRIGLPDAL